MSNCIIENVILDPSGLNLTIYKSEGAVIPQTDLSLRRERTFNGGVAVLGKTTARSWSGNFRCSRNDYYDLKGLEQQLNDSLEDGVEPFGDLILYNFIEPYSENGKASRKRFVVPSQENPNPHILIQKDVGDSKFNWTYYICQQGQIIVTPRIVDDEEATFNLEFIESRLKPSSEEV